MRELSDEERKAMEVAAITLHQRMGTKLRTHPWIAISDTQRNIWRDRVRPVIDSYRAALAAREPTDGNGLINDLEANLKAFARVEDKRAGGWIARQLGEVRELLAAPRGEKLPGDDQRQEAPLERSVSSCCEAWIDVRPGDYHCSACGMTCEAVRPVVRDTEREREEPTHFEWPERYEAGKTPRATACEIPLDWCSHTSYHKEVTCVACLQAMLAARVGHAEVLAKALDQFFGDHRFPFFEQPPSPPCRPWGTRKRRENHECFH